MWNKAKIGVCIIIGSLLLTACGTTGEKLTNGGQASAREQNEGNDVTLDKEKMLEEKIRELKKQKLKELQPIKKIGKKESAIEPKFMKANLLISKPNASLHLDFFFENISDDSITVVFNTGQQFDYYIYNENNELVYHWSKGRYFTQAIKEITLDKGDRLSYQTDWNFTDNQGQKLPDGKYHIEVWLTGQAKADKAGTIVNQNELIAVGSIETVN
ncbi:BsuPI-related putative proteinase inhibitor [Bacillus kwashiorkori]|uniref:BsuPI-related putative proteinase inhibitor n=1 Tax=Bacillus kwashiorkori TaxID=1522318 RepID=UPI00078266F5|nr:BsuPI-related putative proteinase inhibitor [Bacillus kwashiorkori]